MITSEDIISAIYEEVSEFINQRRLITEADARIESAKRVIRDRFNGLLDLDAIVSDPDYYVGGNPNATWLQYILFNLRHTFGLMQNSDAKFVKFIAPIAYSDDVKLDMQGQNNEAITKLVRIVNILKDESNGIFNKIKDKSLSYNDLLNIITPVLTKQDNEEKETLAKTDFGERNTSYKIIEDADYNIAHKYGNKSCPSSKLCYTQSQSTWDNYTKDGLYKCYILVSKDYNEIKPEHTAPVYEFLPTDAYDRYGLSMIVFFINPDNEIVTSNTRWNHEADYGNRSVDNAFTKVDISKIIGANFDGLFKGYGNEELKQKGVKYIRFDEVQELLDSGVDPEDIFDIVNFDSKEGFYKGELNDKYNFINNEGKIISQQWFNWAGNFKEGFARVELNGKYNFINTEGKIISQQWFNWVEDFKEGFFLVQLNNKYNFINTNGEYLSNQWFDSADCFYEGLACVRLNNKWNFINTNGEYLSNQWFDMMSGFNEGFFLVKLNNKWNFINANGEYLSNQWFDRASIFQEGFAGVTLNDKKLYIDQNGILHTDRPEINEAKRRLKQIIREVIKEEIRKR